MRIVKIDPLKINKRIVERAAHVIQRGEILAYPTDTCYGLGVDPKNEKAVFNLARLKGRKVFKKFSVIVSDFLMLKQICQINKKQEEILNKYLPGPYTFILKLKKGNETIGIRIPNCAFTKMLSCELNIPYTSTSANLSGDKECYSAKSVVKQFSKQKIKPNLIIDAGNLPPKPPSTVIDLTIWPPKILRKGESDFSI